MKDSHLILHGDCFERMLEMADNGEMVDAIVTDPPYGLSFMGKKWDKGVPSSEIWKRCLSVLKPGGHLLCFAGTRTHHRMATAIEDAGFEIRDMIAWVYGSGFPKSHNGPWGGTALKPALEPITVARKPLIGTVAANVEAFGTGGLNIDGCRVDGEPWKPHVATGLAKDKFFTRGTAVEIEKNPHDLGRWPANLIHDGSDEVAGLLGSAARFFYCAKASKKDRDEGCDGMDARARPTMGSGIGGQPDQQRENNCNHHPTVKPTDLMRYLCRLVTPPGGVVLDPFMGSGSTGKAAILEGFGFVGIELEPDYIEIARARIAHAAGLIAENLLLTRSTA